MYAQLLSADEDTAERAVSAALAGAEEIREPDRFVWSSAELPPQTSAGQAELLRSIARTISFFLFNHTGKFVQEITSTFLPFADAFWRYIAALDRRQSCLLSTSRLL